MTKKEQRVKGIIDIQCFILAAGSHRYVGIPCSLWTFSNGKSILDWQINSLYLAYPESRVTVVIGYHYEDIVRKYPHLNFYHVLNWETGNALQSFLQIPFELDIPVMTVYGDTVFHPETIEEFSRVESDVTVGIDSNWHLRFKGRSQIDINQAETLNVDPFGLVEYTGLIKFSVKAMRFITSNKHKNSGHSFLNLIEILKDANFNIKYFNACGRWAEMNEPNDLVRFILGTKAETLKRIRPLVKHSVICDQFICQWHRWESNKNKELTSIRRKFGDTSLIVRSSSIGEDDWQTTGAGTFKSILDVNGCDSTAVAKAIDDVFVSYDLCVANGQVLIQPFVGNTVISGVVFTCDLTTGAPYYIINYDNRLGSTEAVTSGNYNDLKTTVVVRTHHDVLRKIDARLLKVIKAVRELQDVLGYNKLDIEFAMDASDQVYTFQVRPIVVDHAHYKMDEKILTHYLKNAQDNFRRWQCPAPHILGAYTLFSNMTDWNPAEIIGTRPNSLAISLYRHVITDEIWALQRTEFGYRDTRPSPLVHSFCGQPYVDCRVSLNSFIPGDLPEDTAERLVTAYLNILRDNSHLHDKMEMNVALTIWTPTFKRDVAKRFQNQDINNRDIDLLEASLKKLTVGIFDRFKSDLKPLKTLESRFQQIKMQDLSAIEKIYLLIEDCKKYGTLSFAHAARAGFAAVTFLKCLVEDNILSKERMLQFQCGINTVVGEFRYDIGCTDIPIDILIEKYGHLRPGTYDVNQKSYWENPDFYFHRGKKLKQKHNKTRSDFKFSDNELAKMQAVLDVLPSKIFANEFVNYLGQAIEAREKSKFIFTRNLGLALDTLLKYGTDEMCLTREEVGYMKWSDIDDLRTGQSDREIVKSLIDIRMQDNQQHRFVKLPAFIKSEDDFFCFEKESAIPNFITYKSIIGDVVFIEEEMQTNLNGKIILIPNADPGYDWLFTRNIAGLITRYGGANSHMAIRCAEIGLPAAIGVGDKIYENIEEGRVLLDCLKGRVERV